MGVIGFGAPRFDQQHGCSCSGRPRGACEIFSVNSLESSFAESRLARATISAVCIFYELVWGPHLCRHVASWGRRSDPALVRTLSGCFTNSGVHLVCGGGWGGWAAGGVWGGNHSESNVHRWGHTLDAHWTHIGRTLDAHWTHIGRCEFPRFDMS